MAGAVQFDHVCRNLEITDGVQYESYPVLAYRVRMQYDAASYLRSRQILYERASYLILYLTKKIGGCPMIGRWADLACWQWHHTGRQKTS